MEYEFFSTLLQFFSDECENEKLIEINHILFRILTNLLYENDLEDEKIEVIIFRIKEFVRF